MYELRSYQKATIADIFRFMRENDGNPVVVAPTGSGKSVMIAEVCRRGISMWADTKILILSHQKELLEQDKAKLQALLPDADIGVYSASLGSKDLTHSITYASIQSIARTEAPLFDVIIVDECHLINNEERGQYRTFLDSQNCRIIGFTATPYRLGQGAIVDDNSVFTDYIKSVDIRTLQDLGYLARLKTKGTMNVLSLNTIAQRGGEFVQKDMDKAINIYKTNLALADEIVSSAKVYNRHHILVFCTSVEHAKNMADLLNEKGLRTSSVEGNMSKTDREETLFKFTHGELDCLCNVNILTTGFDYPAIDLIALIRGTMSPGLYSQMLGRGLRIADGKQDCLVLDFAENVKRHGPITAIGIPDKHKKGNGIVPSKTCPECLDIVPAQARICPSCGHKFPHHSKIYSLFMGDINGDDTEETFIISGWKWVRRQSKKGLDMVEVSYETGKSSSISEYLCIGYDGYALKKCLDTLMSMLEANNKDINQYRDVDYEFGFNVNKMWLDCSNLPHPEAISTIQDGKYARITGRLFTAQMEKEMAADEAEKMIEEETRRTLFHE